MIRTHLIAPLCACLCVSAAARAAGNASPPLPDPKDTNRTVTVQGEKFVKRSISDPSQNGMPVAWLYAPESWKVDGRVEWHYQWVSNLTSVSLQVANPANTEAFYGFPQVKLEYIEVPQNLQQYAPKHQPGELIGDGAMWLQPRPAIDTLALFVKRLRGNEPNVHPLGKAEVPGLAKLLGVPDLPNEQGVAVKIGYDVDGKPVEEAFFAIYYSASGHGEGKAAVLTQTNWGLIAVHSFRAPAGTLDKRMPVFTAIDRSILADPDWILRTAAIQTVLRKNMAHMQQQGQKPPGGAPGGPQGQGPSGNQGGGGQAPSAQMLAQEVAAEDASLHSKPWAGVDVTNNPFWSPTPPASFDRIHWTDGYVAGGNWQPLQAQH
jgi:hypothetical protein